MFHAVWNLDQWSAPFCSMLAITTLQHDPKYYFNAMNVWLCTTSMAYTVFDSMNPLRWTNGKMNHGERKRLLFVCQKFYKIIMNLFSFPKFTRWIITSKPMSSGIPWTWERLQNWKHCILNPNLSKWPLKSRSLSHRTTFAASALENRSG